MCHDPNVIEQNLKFTGCHAKSFNIWDDIGNEREESTGGEKCLWRRTRKHIFLEQLG